MCNWAVASSLSSCIVIIDAWLSTVILAKLLIGVNSYVEHIMAYSLHKCTLYNLDIAIFVIFEGVFVAGTHLSAAQLGCAALLWLTQPSIPLWVGKMSTSKNIG